MRDAAANRARGENRRTFSEREERTADEGDELGAGALGPESQRDRAEALNRVEAELDVLRHQLVNEHGDRITAGRGWGVRHGRGGATRKERLKSSETGRETETETERERERSERERETRGRGEKDTPA